MSKPLVCSGIGHGTQQADQKGHYKICLGSGRLDDYTAPELLNAQTPALLGQRSMKKLRTLIDTFTGKMFLVGLGGYEIHLSPGSEVHELEESSAGHLMLPCSRFGRQQAQKTEESQIFTVGEYYIAKSEPVPQEVSPLYSGTARTVEPEQPRSSSSAGDGRYSQRFQECWAPVNEAVAEMLAAAGISS